MNRIWGLLFLLFIAQSSFQQDVRYIAPNAEFSPQSRHIGTNRYLYNPQSQNIIWFTSYGLNQWGRYVFNQEMNLIESEIIKLEGERYDHVVEVLQLNLNAYFLYSRYDIENEVESLSFQKISIENGDFDGEEQQMIQIKDKLSNVGNGRISPSSKQGKYKVLVSPDKNSVAILYRTRTQRSKPYYEFTVKVFDNELNEKWSQDVIFAADVQSSNFPTVFFSNESVYLYAWTKSEKGSTYDGVSLYEVKEDETIKLQLPTETTYRHVYPKVMMTEDGELAVINSNGNEVSTTMSIGKMKEVEFYLYNEKQSDFKLVTKLKVSDFAHEYPVELRSSNETEDEISILVRKVFKRNDGGYYLIFNRNNLVASIDVNRKTTFKRLDFNSEYGYHFENNLFFINYKYTTYKYNEILKNIGIEYFNVNPDLFVEGKEIVWFDKSKTHIPFLKNIQQIYPGVITIDQHPRKIYFEYPHVSQGIIPKPSVVLLH